ncbi:SDR family NAD(P)-dependent oxidoreductase [Aquipuribacter nitratireducens]|uniref:SDR family NAD(P)-dependent oxidoreductase n=1 Tax=Aquipuribacter nitratireducens TaxID=650104 RepID=A0ABW0GKC2_9MICO
MSEAVNDPGTAAAAAAAGVRIQSWDEQVVPGRFDGRTVVVTGAGSGIGRATTSRIAREGGRVVAADVSASRLDELAASGDAPGVVTVAGDVREEADIARIVAAADGRVDGLANVAGVMDNMEALHEVPDDVWERVLSINLDGVFRLTRAVLPLMLSAGSGAVVNVTSEAGLRGSAAGLAYTASKHAVIGLTRNASVTYAPLGIRVNAVAPGPVVTNISETMHMGAGMGPPRFGSFMGALPPAALATQLAASITWLLSDDATNVSGAVLPSDLGWSVQ